MQQIDYVFVVFGGACAYHDDDMNKVLWMAQAAGAAAPPLLTQHGEFRVDTDASAALHRSLLYRCASSLQRRHSWLHTGICRLSYYRFASLRQGVAPLAGVLPPFRSRVRGVQVSVLSGGSTGCEDVRSGRKTYNCSM